MSHFVVNNPNESLSPLTGMTRSHYVDLAKYILERVFNSQSMEEPLCFPRMSKSKSYPEEGAPPWRWASHRFECLERTFCLAAPLLHVEPDVVLCGGRIALREYFQVHLEHALTAGHLNSVPVPDTLPDATCQF